MAVWRAFTDLDLSDAKPGSTSAACTTASRGSSSPARARWTPTRRSWPALATPSSVPAAPWRLGSVLQAKGFPYSLRELLGRAERALPYEGGSYVTLRLTSAMYHRFHAPHDARVEHVSYLSGDTWNVNPIALKRVKQLFCRNERAVIRLRLSSGDPLTLVPVAAILVASIRLHCLDVLLHLRWPGPHELPCDARVKKGQEMGWFEHGSTIIVLAPPGFELAGGVREGQPIRVGQPLMRLPDPD
jgi:phosphatidylserine decarboxylase